MAPCSQGRRNCFYTLAFFYCVFPLILRVLGAVRVQLSSFVLGRACPVDGLVLSDPGCHCDHDRDLLRVRLFPSDGDTQAEFRDTCVIAT